MPEYKRVFSRGGTYFFTVVTYRRIPIFINDSRVNYFKKCIKDTMRRYPFKVEAMVVLPDHIHTIWTLPEKDDDFSTRWMLIKKRFSIHHADIIKSPVSESRLKKREYGIWQRRFWEHLIRNDEDYALHCDYIHYNPIKHGLVDSPGLWKYSSFNQFVKNGYYPYNWGTVEPEKIHCINYE
jgi:putative transposase